MATYNFVVSSAAQRDISQSDFETLEEAKAHAVRLMGDFAARLPASADEQSVQVTASSPDASGFQIALTFRSFP